MVQLTFEPVTLAVTAEGPAQVAERVDECLDLVKDALEGTGFYLILGHRQDEHPLSIMLPVGPPPPGGGN